MRATPAAEVGERFGFTSHRIADAWPLNQI